MPWTYQRGKRYWRQFRVPRYSLQDEFSVARASPLPSPLIATPGPGSWLLTDLDLRLSVAGNTLVYAAPPGAPNWNRTMLQSSLSFQRKRGRFIEFEFTPSNIAYLRAGFNNSANPIIDNNEAAIYVGGGGFINVTDGADAASPLYPYVTGQSYTCRIYDTGSGFLYYVRPSNVASWTLIWERITSSPRLTLLWPNVNNHSIQGSTDFIRVLDGMLKPPVVFAAIPPVDYAVQATADGLFECAVKAPVNSQRSIYFRMVDGTSYWRLVMDTAANTFTLKKSVGGVESTVALTSVAWSPGQTYLLRAVCFGANIRLFHGLNSGPSITDSFNQTATLLGTGPIGGGAPGSTGDYLNLKAQTGGALLLY
jgi:hypothetical protein